MTTAYDRDTFLYLWLQPLDPVASASDHDSFDTQETLISISTFDRIETTRVPLLKATGAPTDINGTQYQRLEPSVDQATHIAVMPFTIPAHIPCGVFDGPSKFFLNPINAQPKWLSINEFTTLSNLRYGSCEINRPHTLHIQAEQSRAKRATDEFFKPTSKPLLDPVQITSIPRDPDHAFKPLPQKNTVWQTDLSGHLKVPDVHIDLPPEQKDLLNQLTVFTDNFLQKFSTDYGTCLRDTCKYSEATAHTANLLLTNSIQIKSLLQDFHQSFKNFSSK